MTDPLNIFDSSALRTGLRSVKFLPKEPDFIEIKVFFIAKNAKRRQERKEDFGEWLNIYF